jgi:hypothetical protein
VKGCQRIACSSSIDASRSATLSLIVEGDGKSTLAMGHASVTRESESMDYVSFRKGDRTLPCRTGVESGASDSLSLPRSMAGDERRWG